MHLLVEPMSLDGTPQDDAYSPLRGQGGYREVAAAERYLIGGSVPCPSLGRHTLGFAATSRIYVGSAGQAGVSRLCHERKLRLEKPFEVLQSPAPGCIIMVSDPSLEPILRTSLQPGDFIWTRWFLDGQVSCQAALPVNIAFDILVRISGEEYVLGPTCAAKGDRRLTWGLRRDLSSQGYRGPAPESLDVILRSSEKAARDTVDLFEIWQGELVYKDVPVQAK